MEEIEGFLKGVFLLEQKAIDARRYPAISVFNEKFNELMLHSNSEDIKFEMGVLDDPLPDFMYEAMQSSPEPIPRHIFKISKYANAKYKEIYACYVSGRKPPPTVGLYGNCYMIGWVGNHLKFVGQYHFTTRALSKRRWTFTGGDRDLTFKNLGKPVEILRLLPPKDDPDSMEDYLLDR